MGSFISHCRAHLQNLFRSIVIALCAPRRLWTRLVYWFYGVEVDHTYLTEKVGDVIGLTTGRVVSELGKDGFLVYSPEDDMLFLTDQDEFARRLFEAYSSLSDLDKHVIYEAGVFLGTDIVEELEVVAQQSAFDAMLVNTRASLQK